MEIFLGVLLTSFFFWLIVCSQFLEELTWKRVSILFIACVFLSLTGRFFGILRISIKVTSQTLLKGNASFDDDVRGDSPTNGPEEIASAEAVPFVTISTDTPNPGTPSGSFSPISSGGIIPQPGSPSSDQGIASK